jgi:YidC/Oxa1 family membrane protein insertase
MDQQKRLLLAIGLSFGLTLVFTNFIWKPQAEEAARLMAFDSGVTAVLDAGAAGEAAAPTLLAAVAIADGGTQAPPAVEAPLRTFTVDRPSMKLAFTSQGAGLFDAVLLGKRERVEQVLSIPDGYRKMFGKTFDPPPQVDLAEPRPSGPPQLAISFTGATPISANQRYTVVDEAPGHVVFQATVGPYEVTKTFTWSTTATTSEKDPSGYLSTLAVTVTNTSATAQAGELVVHTTRAINPGQEEAPSMFGGIGNESTVLCRVGDDVKRKQPDNESPLDQGQGALHFVAIDQSYFLTAVWPLEGAVEGQCMLEATKTVRNANLAVPLTLQPGESQTKRYGIFLGPKDLELLQAVAKVPAATPPTLAATFDPQLEKTVDFGIWAFIAKALVVFLRFFRGAVGNWGLAIIALTIAVKLVLLPLTHKAMVSAEQMKKLQPKMEEIRKKFPEDKEKQNMEMMKLYQEAKVNPLGGCLPLLLQLPIWAALFTTLRTSYELYGESFFGVWSDLTSKDPTYILPLALGVTMIVTQRLQPQMTMDKSQAILMTWVMPVFFTAIMMNYPAGLALYIFTNNLLSIIQQYALRKWLASRAVAT